MPYTAKGAKVMAAMRRQYGAKKAKEVFYASINKGVPGSSGWHAKKAKRPLERVRDQLRRIRR